MCGTHSRRQSSLGCRLAGKSVTVRVHERNGMDRNLFAKFGFVILGSSRVAIDLLLDPGSGWCPSMYRKGRVATRAPNPLPLGPARRDLRYWGLLLLIVCR